jgi:hypothetical protein
LVGDRPIAHIERALIRVLEPTFGRPIGRILTKIQLAVRNPAQPSTIDRLIYEYVPTFRPPDTMKIKVEVNFNERRPCYAIVDLAYSPPLDGLNGSLVLKSYDLDEMLGTKMRALLQRTQGRDLFDLDRACLRHDEAVAVGIGPLVVPQRVVGAFATYMEREGVRIKRAEYEAALRAKCRNRAFRNDMTKVLPPGVDYDIDAAAERVRDILIARLPS